MNNSKEVVDSQISLSKVRTFVRKNKLLIIPSFALVLGMGFNKIVQSTFHNPENDALREKERAESAMVIEHGKGLVLKQFSLPGCSVEITDTSKFFGEKIEIVLSCTAGGVTNSKELECFPREKNHFGGILCKED